MSILGRLIQLLDEAGARYALVGGHAVSAHTRPRLTVDVDLVVEARKRAAIERAAIAHGFQVKGEKDVLRLVDSGHAADAPVADLLLADSHPVWAEALRTSVTGVYQGHGLPVATTPALVAMKFVAATSPDRPQEDRLQDVSDVSRLVKTGWTEADSVEALRIVSLAHSGAAQELDRLISDLRAGRPVTI